MDELRKAPNSCAQQQRRLINWSGQRLEDKLKQDGFPSFSEGKIGQPLLMWLNFRPGNGTTVSTKQQSTPFDRGSAPFASDFISKTTRWRKRRKLNPRASFLNCFCTLPSSEPAPRAPLFAELFAPRLFTPPFDLTEVCGQPPVNTRPLATVKMAAYGTFSSRFLRPGPDSWAVWSRPGRGEDSQAPLQPNAFCRKWVQQLSAWLFRRLALAVWRAHNIRLHSRSQPNVNFIL